MGGERGLHPGGFLANAAGPGLASRPTPGHDRILTHILRMPSRSAYIILASVLFGVLVWFSVAMSEQYQVSIAAPLQIERVPDGRALRTPVPPALQLRLR